MLPVVPGVTFAMGFALLNPSYKANA